MKLFLLAGSLFIALLTRSQQSTIILIASAENKTPVVASVTIKELHRTISTDTMGLCVFYFPGNQIYTLQISSVGYDAFQTKIRIPYPGDTIRIDLEPVEVELEEIIVQSTRTSRNIRNVPTRVEMVELEEIDEKSNMRPGNVAMLLHESTGIQVQQTSATSANASIRIQGLDGRYTQLLKDGFANFGNFSSGLSVLEIPPLDLSQVEIIKGPASPMFGGGAIAGVINFISKTPKVKPEYSFILNQSNIGQSNIGAYASQRIKKFGYSVLALYNRQKAYDKDNDDFTEIPKAWEWTVHPTVYFYPNEQTRIRLGHSLSKSDRHGGDIYVVNGQTDSTHQYEENNKTIRSTTNFEFEKKINDNEKWLIKQSFGIFDRSIRIPSYLFKGISYNAFTDVAYLINRKKHDLVVGANLVYDQFREGNDSSAKRDNLVWTAGFYGQHTLDASDNIKLETGLRLELARYSNSIYQATEFFFLPRISLLITYNPNLSSRIGAGIGYKAPTLFTETTETIQYRSVAQLNQVHSEKSYGATADINFRKKITHDLNLSFNHLFFYSIIEDPLILEMDLLTVNRFRNMAKPIHTAGFETNMKLIYDDHLKLFLGYTYTKAKGRYLSGNQFLPLVPKGKLNAALIYEKEGVIKLGLEGYFTGRQYLSDGTKTPSFNEFGFMAEKIFSHFSMFINFENFTDTYQGRYKPLVSGSHLSPSFDEIWTHTEGFVFNGGIKVKL